MKTSIIYDSRTHTTEKAAAFIAKGIMEAGNNEVRCFNIDEADLEYIKQSDMVIFGSPTYMASVTGKMKNWLESNIIYLCMWILSIIIFVIVYGRMIEIYLTVSLAPIPFSTLANREWGQIGQNYLRSLFALAFQGFLILVCVAIYAVLVQTIPASDNIHGSIWGTAGYTVLLAFALFKTGSLSKSVFNAH